MTNTAALVTAIAAGTLAVISLALAVWFSTWMRRVRRAQEALLAGRNVDLVEFAVGMQARMERVEQVASDAIQTLAAAQRRLDACYQRRALVRYDALRDAGGHQSVSIAILDAHGSGAVVSAIQGRDQARIYVKDVVARKPGSVELTPEEQQAVDRAMT
jgi:Protein of unknown function (DUF4446)